MKFLIAGILALSINGAFAQEKMGSEALEMLSLMSNPVASDCVQSVGKMVNVEIVKKVYRCPGCTTYVISGNELAIDIPRPEKTVITLDGKSVPGTFRNWVQTFTCDIKNK